MPAPRRKYTRRVATPVTQASGVVDRPSTGILPRKRKVGFDPMLTMPYGSELEIVTEIVTRLRSLDAKARVRVTNAIGKLL